MLSRTFKGLIKSISVNKLNMVVVNCRGMVHKQRNENSENNKFTDAAHRENALQKALKMDVNYLLRQVVRCQSVCLSIKNYTHLPFSFYNLKLLLKKLFYVMTIRKKLDFIFYFFKSLFMVTIWSMTILLVSKIISCCSTNIKIALTVQYLYI